MEAIIFCGIQGSGKTTFYTRNFLHTHVRISMDLLKTRHREWQFLQTALLTMQPFVVDNTNASAAFRKRYIEAARPANFRVIGYYFQSDLRNSIARNDQREGSRRIPLRGVLGTYKGLTIPAYEEGFDALFNVRIARDGEFIVQPWSEGIVK